MRGLAMESSAMAQDGYRLRGDGSNDDIILRLEAEIDKLESQLARLQVEDAPHRFSLMKTYRTMIESRMDLLNQMRT
ncbi:hypothetical protein QNI23_002060 [Bermanella sp. WJH001]|uniref:hypothetical protein n=1 Tax=Bermanella sp. WJH001 TaxID=3048005 RepID=UPI0024BE9E47|nr:hypothetical protein [Bermanella sp. WJH001]MDJ1538459.1 hypothetical protein [Bermanella sp. WJH001]